MIAYLKVHITKRPSHRAHQILNLPLLRSHITKLNHILQRTVRTRRVVQERPCARNSVISELALVRRQFLPNPPHAVDVGVVQVESRVARGCEDVVTGVATEGVVAAAVDADLWGEVLVGLAREEDG